MSTPTPPPHHILIRRGKVLADDLIFDTANKVWRRADDPVWPPFEWAAEDLVAVCRKPGKRRV